MRRLRRPFDPSAFRPFDPSTGSGSPRAKSRGDKLRVVPSSVEGRASLTVARGESRGNGRDVDAVRRFNRFYTRRIGVLDEGHLQSPYSLAEVRVLYELAHRETTTAVELCRDLGLDPGYLSRILRRFTRERLVRKTRAESDRRQALLSLTPKGQRVFAPLNEGARSQVTALLEPLSGEQRRLLVRAMERIEKLLDRPL